MAGTWEKRWGYVVYARYRDDEDLPEGCEEEFYLSYAKAEKAAAKWQEDPDIETVNIEEEEREIWIQKKPELER